MGKGDARRPAQVSDDVYAANFARTFPPPAPPANTEGQGGVMIDFRMLGIDERSWLWPNTDEGPE